VGYNNPNLNTPHVDALAADGLKLTAHYTYKFCAPTRGSFLTGRLPFKLSATRANLIPWTLPDGTHLGYSMLPRKLKASNYWSAHIGKWHQGFYTPEYTPIGRGFDHSFGFLEGGEDHNKSTTFGNWCKKGEVDLSYGVGAADGQPYPWSWEKCTWTKLPGTALHAYMGTNSTDILGYNPYSLRTFGSEDACATLCENRLDCAGYSWRQQNNTGPNVHKCFLVSKVGTPKAIAGFASASCTRPMRANTTIAAEGKNGTYTGLLFADEAVRVINEHSVKRPTQPMFMYLALHDTHSPLEAPWPYVAPYAAKWPTDTKRSIFSGMVSYVDETTKNVTNTLRSAGMWDNTLFVWTTDNGSPVSEGGSNHPLKGGKGTNWEGGCRVPTFITGGILPPAQRGKVHAGLIAISDWHTTILTLAGVDPSAGEPSAPSPLDGVDAWPWLSGASPYSSRHELVYDNDMFASRGNAKQCLNVTTKRAGPGCMVGAIQRDGWKLILKTEANAGWYGWFSPNISYPLNKSSPEITQTECSAAVPCLYNLNVSITEHDNVADEHPDVVAALVSRMIEVAEEYHPPQMNPPVDLDGYCAAVKRNDNFVGPWMLKTNDQILPPPPSLLEQEQ